MIEPTFEVRGGGGPGGVTRAQARKTAGLVASVLLLFAAWQFYRGRVTATAVLGGVGVLLLLVGLFVPALARRFHIFWMRAATALGYVNSRVLLSLIYFGLFTPYRLVSRLAGRDPLRRRGRPRESYWVERERTRQEKEQFERLF
ncbi:MAG TPA: SxtJ family membrane protein [Pyrinomonadaceae bacterium]|nr:SxtJ family membrane protein [Pyrinomonadaceae bacterium]